MTKATNNSSLNKTTHTQSPEGDNALSAQVLPKDELLASGDLGLPSDIGPLPRGKLIAARFQVFDFFKKATVLLAKRPFKLISRIPSGAKMLSISLRITTQHSRPERGAVSVSAKYYTLFGRKIIDVCPALTHRLFADSTDNIINQPCYFSPPKEAYWVKLTMQRNTAERRIAVFGSLRPRPHKPETDIVLHEALASRDDMQLRFLLDNAVVNSDRVQARQLLARLIFLRRKPEDQQMLKVISDVDELLLSPPPGCDVKQQKAESVFDYKQLFLPPYDGTYPLSKWLLAEAQRLRAACEGHSVHVPEGPELSLRLMAATSANMKLSSGIDTKNVAGVPWVKMDEVLAYTGNFKI